VLDDLTAALPDRVWLREVVYNPERIQVKGRARANNLLADYISCLEQSPGLTGVMLRSSVQKRGRSSDYQEFALQALVRGTEGEETSASVSPAARLEEFEKLLPSRQETGDMLR
jgi:Tfp pilus assembly protein PilN